VKIAVIVYHKNADTLYPKGWIDEFRNSILNQTHKDFDIIECNYGGKKHRIFDTSEFYSIKYPTFVHALNDILTKAFYEYDYVFNTNVDDFYAVNRIEKQLPYLQQGYDIVSSDFMNVYDNGEWKPLRFHDKDIAYELGIGHNVICHPCVAYSKKFWQSNRYVPNEIPLEDLLLWQRSHDTHKFIILKDILCFHRIHESSVCRSTNR
jgi:hypothetical protein